MNKLSNYKEKQEQLLIEGYQEMAEENLKIVKEWQSAEAKWPEWKE